MKLFTFIYIESYLGKIIPLFFSFIINTFLFGMNWFILIKDTTFSEYSTLVERLRSNKKVVTSTMRHGIACESLGAIAYDEVNKFLNLKLNIVEMLFSLAYKVHLTC